MKRNEINIKNFVQEMDTDGNGSISKQEAMTFWKNWYTKKGPGAKTIGQPSLTSSKQLFQRHHKRNLIASAIWRREKGKGKKETGKEKRKKEKQKHYLNRQNSLIA